MTAIGRVLIVEQSASVAPLLPLLSEQGLSPVVSNVRDMSPDKVRRSYADVILVGDTADSQDVIRFVQALKNDSFTRDIPVIAVDPGKAADLPARFIRAGFDDVISPPVTTVGMMARLRSLLRMSTLRTELLRRRDTLERFMIDVPAASLGVIGVDNARLLSVGRALSKEMANGLRKGLSVDQVGDAATALTRLTDGNYDATVVFVDAVGLDDALILCADIRANSSLFNLPVILVLDADSADAVQRAYGQRASDVLLAPVRPEDLRNRVVTWVRQQRYRQRLFEASHKSNDKVTVDGLTGLYSHGFARDYLNDLIEYSAARGTTFSVAYFDLPRLPEINRLAGYCAGEHLLRQVGQMLGNMVRAEDLAGRYRGKEFCVILPQTALRPAQIVVDRIIGVISSTEFLVTGGYSVLTIAMAAGLAEYTPGDSSDTLIRRARAAMR